MEKTGEGEVMADRGIREDGELVSSTTGGLIHDTFSGPLFMKVVISECGNPWVTAKGICDQDGVVDVPKGRASSNVAPR